MTAEELFWELVEPMYADPAVSRSTMMGLPCVRFDGRFFASLDRRSGALLVKLPAQRVRQLIDTGHGHPFAPAGRTFREWVAIAVPDRQRWQVLLAEARDHASGTAVEGPPDSPGPAWFPRGRPPEPGAAGHPDRHRGTGLPGPSAARRRAARFIPSQK